MRPTAWVSSLAVFLLTAAVTNGVALAHAKPAAAPKPAAGPAPSWVVVGDLKGSPEEATQDALDKGRAKVTEYLRSQTPPMEWSPDPTWIQQKLLRDLKAEDPALRWDNPEGLKDFDPALEERNINGRLVQLQTARFPDPVRKMWRAAIKLEVSPFARAEIEEQERHWQVKQRQERAASRQGVMVRVLAALVALLAAVACYLRLEDATKGYYTTLLRLAAVGFVALVGAGIWLLT
jgi:hypothetical protein